MDTVILQENERIDDLQCQGRRLIQNKEIFCFGVDAVLLANYAKASTGERCMDLCTGNGIIPVLMEAKTKGQHFDGLEIQALSAELAERNVCLNHAQDRIRIIQGDVKNITKLCKPSGYEVVTVNPPYITEHHGLINPSEPKAIARHEVLCSLEDVIQAAAFLLNDHGRFYMVHRPQRLVEIFVLCRKYGLEPKQMTLVHPYAGKNANMVLIEAVYKGGQQLTVGRPLIVYSNGGAYTEDFCQFAGNGAAL